MSEKVQNHGEIKKYALVNAKFCIVSRLWFIIKIDIIIIIISSSSSSSSSSNSNSSSSSSSSSSSRGNTGV
jgi:beta-lactamase regulating signal transducer with metallopeptidase domain